MKTKAQNTNKTTSGNSQQNRKRVKSRPSGATRRKRKLLKLKAINEGSLGRPLNMATVDGSFARPSTEAVTYGSSGRPSGIPKIEGSYKRPFTVTVTDGSSGRPSSRTEVERSYKRPFTETVTRGTFGQPSGVIELAGSLGRPSSYVVTDGSSGRPSGMAEIEESYKHSFIEAIAGGSSGQPPGVTEMMASLGRSFAYTVMDRNSGRPSGIAEVERSYKRPFTEAITTESSRRPADMAGVERSQKRPFTETITFGSSGQPPGVIEMIESLGRSSTCIVMDRSSGRPSDTGEVERSHKRPFTDAIMGGSSGQPSGVTERVESLGRSSVYTVTDGSYGQPCDMIEIERNRESLFSGTVTVECSERPSVPAPKDKNVEIGTQKRHLSDNSTPTKCSSKTWTGTSTSKKSNKKTTTVFHMAFMHENLEVSLTEEESEKLKDWILHKIDRIEGGEIFPRFKDCRHRAGALHITCLDTTTRDWLGRLIEQEEPWIGAKLKYLPAEGISKPVRAMVWVTDLTMEPSQILSRIAKQNPGISTSSWHIISRKKDANAQQLVIRMDQTSWDKLGTTCNYKPHFNFKRVRFRLLDKKKIPEDQAQIHADTKKEVKNIPVWDIPFTPEYP